MTYQTIFADETPELFSGQPLPNETKEVSAIRRFVAAFSGTTWIGEALTRWFDANNDELWRGEGDLEGRPSMTKEERAALIRRRLETLRAGELQAWRERYGDAAQAPGGIAGFLGAAAATITDPALIPLLFMFPVSSSARAAAGLARGAGAGAAVGGLSTAASQLGEPEGISAVDVAISTGVGAALGGLLTRFPQILTRAPTQLLRAVTSAEDPQAVAAFERLQTALAEARISHPFSRLPPDVAYSPEAAKMFSEVWEEGMRRARMTGEDLANIARQLGRVPLVPETKEEAIAMLAPQGAVKQGLLSRLLEPAMDTLERVAPALTGRMASTYFEAQRLAYQVLQHGFKPMVEAYRKLTPAQRAEFHVAALNADRTRVVQLVGEDAVRAWETWSKKMFRAAMPDVPEVAGFYMPRYLVPDAYRKTLGDEGFKRWLAGREPTPERAVEYFFMRPERNIVGRTTSLRERVLEHISAEQAHLFSEFPQAASLYVQRMSHEIWMRQFFGGALAKTKVGDVDLDASIANALNRQTFVSQFGLVPEWNQRLVATLVKTVFEGPRRQMAPLLQAMRNITYAGLLGNLPAAITQLGDIPLVVAANGFRAGIAGIVGKKYINAVDWGMTNAATELTASPSRSARFMEGALKWGGFSRLDIFGKSAHLNATIHHLLSAARTPQGRNELTKLYGKVFPERWSQILSDLQNGVASTDVKILALYRLSSIQPIAPFSMPVAWLENPNARIFYMLKTFTLRNVAFAIAEHRRLSAVSPRTAARFAAGFGLAWALSGLPATSIKALLAGDELSADRVTDAVFDSMMKLWGGSSWIVQNHLAAGRIDRAFGQVASPPPLVIISAVAHDMLEAAKRGDLEHALLYGETARYIPVAGRIYYEWFGGGFEKRLTKFYKTIEAKRHVVPQKE